EVDVGGGLGGGAVLDGDARVDDVRQAGGGELVVAHLAWGVRGDRHRPLGGHGPHGLQPARQRDQPVAVRRPSRWAASSSSPTSWGSLPTSAPIAATTTSAARPVISRRRAASILTSCIAR